MAATALIAEYKERWVWIAIILLPFVCLMADFFTGGFSQLFEGTIDRELYKIIFYPAMLCLPSLILASIFFSLDFFTQVMFAFCLLILAYLPLHYFEAFLSCLKAGTCLKQWM